MNVASGFEGESLVREYLKRKNIKHMQVDVIFEYEGRYNLMEIKNQEHFVSPPFDGHGLPRWQVDARLTFYKETGVVPWLFVIEKGTTLLYYQSLIKLMEGESIQTNGGKPRIIFPLVSFKSVDLVDGGQT
jgi:hypothetical protein